MKTLETPRLLLRPWTLEDAPDMYDYARTANVGPAAGWKPHESIEETRRILREKFLVEDECFAMQRKDDGRVIGSIGLHGDAYREKTLPVRMLGYVMNERDWGQGFMHEGCMAALEFAFTELGVELMTVYHFPWNERSRRVIERLGFRLEGLRRMASRNYDGRIEDEMAYSMTREEFFAERERQQQLLLSEKRRENHADRSQEEVH